MKKKGFKLNRLLKNLHIDLQEAVSVLKKRPDLGTFEANLSCEINTFQLGALIEYVKRQKTSIKEDVNIKAAWHKKHDKRININERSIKTEISIHNEKQQQIKKIKFRHKKAKIISIKKDGSLIIETSPYSFIYKNDCIVFSYNGTELFFSANGITPILNQHIQDIVRVFPSVRIKVGDGNEFHFMNPKFYKLITDLVQELEKKNNNVELDRCEENNNDDLVNVEYKNEIKEQIIEANNIEFFDYYYKIWVTDNSKVKKRNIEPFIVRDNNSRFCFNILNKYLSNRIPNNIIIRYSDFRIISIKGDLMLGVYVKILKESTLTHGDWEYELNNFNKKTFKECTDTSKKTINKDISYKSIYIDYLASHQSEKQLIKVYEVFNGVEEDCFIFTINMRGDFSAIIFENILFARASELFIVHKDNYVKCINLIFDYFTNYELKNKRLAIKQKLINPDKFLAVNYETIDHNNLLIWISKINKIINGVEVSNDKIQFKPGLEVPKEIQSRTLLKDTILVSNLHKSLMTQLFLKLSQIYGKENVGTEINVGKKRIDLVVKDNNKYNIYEIKTDKDVRTCIRQAIGQIFDYAYFEGLNNIDKMVIIGPSPITSEADVYLTKMRKLHNINIYYETV